MRNLDAHASSFRLCPIWAQESDGEMKATVFVAMSLFVAFGIPVIGPVGIAQAAARMRRDAVR